jgi:membrane protease YdiL (CAAX protease family)
VRLKQIRLFGEIKGPVFVLVLILCLFVPVLLLFRGSSGGSIPQNISAALILGQLTSFGLTYGVWIVVFVGFLAVWEKRRSLKDILYSVGFKKEGLGKSIFWGLLILIPVGLVFYFVTMLSGNLLGPITQVTNSSGASPPTWYICYLIIYAFFPVAIFEEAFGRGYMLDRLMPQKPSGIKEALPAIILSSILFTLFHVPSYILSYSFSPIWAVTLLIGNVLPNSVFLSVSYVRSRTRNIGGPILAHFLMDSGPYLLMLI